MPLATCVRCNRMFNKVKDSVCPGCMPAEEKDREKIHLVLAEHNELKPEEVADLADVDLSVVARMVAEGYVSQLGALERPLCGKCGAPAISMSKKLCQPCLDRLNTEASRAQAKIKLGRRKEPVINTINARTTFEEKRK